MTDSQAIAQVNSMKDEAVAEIAAITSAQGSMNSAVDALDSVVSNINSRLSASRDRITYMMETYGA